MTGRYRVEPAVVGFIVSVAAALAGGIFVSNAIAEWLEGRIEKSVAQPVCVAGESRLLIKGVLYVKYGEPPEKCEGPMK